MATPFLRLPLNCEKVTEGEHLPQCSLKDSIENHVKLILVTKFGENRFNLAYGCEVWEFDFQRIASFNSWRDKIVVSVKESIKSNEKRLYDVVVKLMVEDEESVNDTKKTVVVRKCLRFDITAKLKLTGSTINVSPTLYISPFSVD